jgi:hypothetical protein
MRFRLKTHQIASFTSQDSFSSTKTIEIMEVHIDVLLSPKIPSFSQGSELPSVLGISSWLLTSYRCEIEALEQSSRIDKVLPSFKTYKQAEMV